MSIAFEFSVLGTMHLGVIHVKSCVVQILKSVCITQVVVVLVNPQGQPQLQFFSFALLVCISCGCG